MKIFIILVVCICVFMVGLFFSNYYKNKIKIFLDLIKFCEIYESEIRFSKCEISEIILKNKSQFTTNFYNLLEKYFIYNNKIVDIDCLSKDEILAIESLLSSIGKLDVVGEINNINIQKVKVLSVEKELSSRCDKLSPLSIKLGVLGALLTFIIFI